MSAQADVFELHRSRAPLILPDDEHNRRLVEQVHPPAWVNPEPSGRYNLVVIGGGTAGLVSAAGAAGLGAKVALIEKHLMGGDCLNFGCVPSKALLSAARAAHSVRTAARFGVATPGDARVHFAEVMKRMRGLRANIAPNDSAHRLAKLGVDVYLGEARFAGPDKVEVGPQILSFRRAVIATGGRPAILPIRGLAEAGFLTNETIFSLTELPRRLVVIGAGPIGCELAQAFRRFGSEVSIVALDPRLLRREDADAAALLATQFEREGIRMFLGAKLQRVERRGSDKLVAFERGDGTEEIAGDEILLAAGLRIGDLARTIHPYPTQAEAWKHLGDASRRARLTPGLRQLFRRWFSLHRGSGARA